MKKARITHLLPKEITSVFTHMHFLYILQACPFDHYGENCTFTCNPPKEGYRCVTGECRCNKWACNVSVTSARCFTSKSEFLSFA